MRIIRRVFLILTLLLVGVAIWLGVYAQRKGFTRTWRELVEAEFADRGYYVDIEKLTLGPFQGLVAEKVRFFQDPQRRRELVYVDNVILDLDLTDILNRDLSVNTLDVHDAKLTLPLTPGRRDSELLMVEGFSARLVVTESQIEVVRAQAEVAGVAVSMKGSLYRPPRNVKPTEATEAELAEQKRQLKEIRRRLDRVQRVIAELETFSFSPGDPPRLEIDFAGDLADLAHLHADVRLAAKKFKRGPYAIEDLAVLAEYDGAGQRGILKELYLRDASGELRLRGEWPVAERKIDFEMESSADLPALAAAIWQNPKLGEVVFFSPPKLQMEGSVSLDELGKVTWPYLPMEVMGELRSERFGSRGAVFDGLELQFAAKENRYYIRNLRLDHKTGVMLANLMFDPALGKKAFRFQSEMKLDPSILLPFVSSDRTKRFLTGWQFDESSAVYFAALGSGATIDPDTWSTRGVIDLRQFRRQNIPFDHLETEFDSRGRVHQLSNLRVERPEGVLTAALVKHDVEARTWETEGLESTMDLFATIRAVAPSLAKSLTDIQFSQPPLVKMNGLVDSREASEDPTGEPALHDFELSFSSDQPVSFDFLGRSLPLEQPSGIVRAANGKIRLTEFQAQLFGGKATATFETDRIETDRRYTATIGAEKVAFDDLIRTYGASERKGGGQWSGEMRFGGQLGRPKSVTGEGQVKLSGGNLLAMPMFSPAMENIDKLLSALPKPPEAIAGAAPVVEAPPQPRPEPGASAKFALESGKLTVSALKGTTESLSFEGLGVVDGVSRTLDFELSAEWLNFPGLPEMAKPRVTLKGDGPLAAPNWRMKGVKAP
ncbi:MAG: hypothetical protein KDN20_18980 [Verrucomicrobiae bacterium]|nr:hypothetical protein [Verrucomicrobiae bacterium]